MVGWHPAFLLSCPLGFVSMRAVTNQPPQLLGVGNRAAERGPDWLLATETVTPAAAHQTPAMAG